MWLLTIAIVVLCVVYYFYKPAKPLLHGPRYYFVQAAYEMFRNTQLFFSVKLLELCKKYPKYFQLRTSNDFIIHDPKLLHDFFLSSDIVNHINPRNRFFHADKIPTNTSLISIRDGEWKNRRKHLSPAFNTTKVNGFVPTFSKQASILEQILSEAADSGKVVDMRTLFSNMTADVLGETIFGAEFNSQRDPDNKISNAVEGFLSFAAMGPIFVFPFWYKFPLQGIRKFTRGTQTLLNFCRQILKQREQQADNSDKNDLLQTLMDLNLDYEGSLIPETFLFLLAGHETTANLLSWTVSMIHKHPEVEKKILEEIRQKIGDNEITSENLDSLEYLECVIQESLRLCPPAMITDRDIDKPVEIDGVIFPPKSKFLIPIWAIHHNEEYWPEPEKFDPTRFDAEHKSNIVPFSYIPFGAGPRICLGMKFALIEAKTVLAKLYSKFELKVNGEVVPKLAGGLLRPAKVPVTVIKRK